MTARLVAGLGNPGRRYAKTRHNIGFMATEALGEFFSIAITKNKFDARFGKGKIDGIDAIIAQPRSFMNRSGGPVLGLARYFGVAAGDIIIVHDDIDLDFGTIKIKEKGGHGGHNGLKSLIDVFGDDSFTRVRAGIGRPPPRMDVSDYVLGKFSGEESRNLDAIIEGSRDAVAAVITEGAKTAMNRFNGQRFVAQS
ncbi:Peptidyl-tRNA hydrolase [Candidatus Desulfarcum epimagneticum]|uniref:Peptidyl-tRNA hydrolase n=1 Tax=uncultured Desulfobacteraceae bacterium TaxID=218296 RepID=A0A484HIN7_9BACT|nr:Peptidyl-tRNA hydrolase [uncultured Desulfobacteraceae bacterium]